MAGWLHLIPLAKPLLTSKLRDPIGATLGQVVTGSRWKVRNIRPGTLDLSALRLIVELTSDGCPFYISRAGRVVLSPGLVVPQA